MLEVGTDLDILGKVVVATEQEQKFKGGSYVPLIRKARSKRFGLTRVTSLDLTLRR
jgi:hypothetical protein